MEILQIFKPRNNTMESILPMAAYTIYGINLNNAYTSAIKILYSHAAHVMLIHIQFNYIYAVLNLYYIWLFDLFELGHQFNDEHKNPNKNQFNCHHTIIDIFNVIKGFLCYVIKAVDDHHILFNDYINRRL